MSAFKPSLSDSLRRSTVSWAGIFVVLLAGSLVAYQPFSFWDYNMFVIATGFAFIISVVQAYQNGNVVLSWLLTSAPALVYEFHTYRPYGPGIEVFEIFQLLIAVLFIGTTAHLLGASVANIKENAPQRLSETEERVLAVLLLLLGIPFVYFFVYSTF